ncbi:MAG: LysR family transcriptional regulator [Oscillospiraceae bacterium]|nr:LysR family transcriptional regulator [Oscillospiraceae bacterium]
MTSLQVRYFLIVAEHMSYTAAADALYVSQPALSKQILALEHELQLELFNRSRKNHLELTPAGHILRKVFSEMEGLLRDGKKQASEAMAKDTLCLRVGFVEGADMAALAHFCKKEVAGCYPDSTIEFESHSFKELHANLSAGRLDIIFCAETGLKTFEGLCSKKLPPSRTVLLFSRKHPAAGKEKPTIADFNGDIYFFLPRDEAPLSYEINRSYFLSQGLDVRQCEKPNRESILLALGEGKGFSVFDSKSRYAGYPEFFCFPLDLPIPFRAVWNENNANPLLPIFLDQAILWMDGR